MIVDPTWDDFHENRDSKRLAFLTCVAIFHSVDRMGKTKGEIGNVQEKWREECFEFKLVDIICHHLKHKVSDAEKNLVPGKLPIQFILGFDEDGVISAPDPYYFIRDAVRFVHRKAGTVHMTCH
jgi:hypothetical protein